MDISTLESSIYNLRIPNHWKRHFVPVDALYDLLGRGTIKEALRSSVKEHELDDLTDVVYRYGRLMFAILITINRVGCITKFLERDPSQPNQLDARLPLHEKDLVPRLTFVDAKKFLHEQWTFCVPIFKKFTLRRVFADNIILPFTSDKLLGSGAFGQVYDVVVDSKHQKFADSEQKVIRLHSAFTTRLIVYSWYGKRYSHEGQASKQSWRT
jgi:hypothetical protein